MIKGKTRSGFEFSVNEKIAEDWRVAKAMAAAGSKDQAEQITGVVSMVRLIIGDQEDRLMESIKDKDGIVRTQDMMDNISDILTAITNSGDKGKN